MMRFHKFAIVALLVGISPAFAKITNPVTLEQIVKDQPLIFTAKVIDFLPDKPGMVISPVDKFRGEFPFDRVPINLTGDKEATDEKQSAMLLERLDKDLTLIVFAGRRGKVYDAVAYTNGTWFRMSGVVDKDDGKEVTRWRFTHCEPYFRRTFKGTTEELIKAISGGIKGEKLPAYNEKEEPGYGPVLKKPLAWSQESGVRSQESGVRSQESGNTLFAVIQLPFLGLIVALAALFPAVFGGMALMMRRWVAALSIASFVSILAALFMYFPNWVAWSGIKSVGTLWFTAAAIAGIGALWAGHRYRKAIRDGKSDEFQPRYLDRVILLGAIVLVAGGLAYAVLAKESLRESPWLELILFLVPATACLYFVVAHWMRNSESPVAISAETVGLWSGSFACAVAGAIFIGGPRGPAIVAGGGEGTPKLEEQPVWIFEPKERGAIVSSPCVAGQRAFVAVHHRQGTGQWGHIYALDAETGAILWEFDDEGALKPMFCSPTFANDRLYFGEGYHTDHESKMFCVDAATGKKVWDFPTNSHTESTPAVADGKVVFGAGDDGVYCLDAVTGQKLWQYTGDGGLHVDSNPVILDGRVYAGSGISKKSKGTQLFCLDLKTGNKVWSEKVEYSAWGSPAVAGSHVIFATGNGTFSEDRAPVAGLLLCREAASGKPVWERALPNSLLGKPAVDRYQVYVGCRDGNLYALDRHTGEVVWSKSLQAPILASPVIDINPKNRTGEVLYAIGSSGVLEAIAPGDGAVHWAVNFRELLEMPYVNAVSTPAVMHETFRDKPSRRVLVGMGFGPSSTGTPTARLYCFRDVSE